MILRSSQDRVYTISRKDRRSFVDKFFFTLLSLSGSGIFNSFDPTGLFMLSFDSLVYSSTHRVGRVLSFLTSWGILPLFWWDILPLFWLAGVFYNTFDSLGYSSNLLNSWGILPLFWWGILPLFWLAGYSTTLLIGYSYNFWIGGVFFHTFDSPSILLLFRLSVHSFPLLTFSAFFQSFDFQCILPLFWLSVHSSTLLTHRVLFQSLFTSRLAVL